jgi:hypothetical protein
MMFQFASDCKIQFKSNPKAGNISIRKVGNCKLTNLSSEDKDFLKSLADELVGNDSIETDEVDRIGTQSARAADLLKDWPEGLEWNFDYDPKTVPRKPSLTLIHPTSPRSPSKVTEMVTGNNAHYRTTKITMKRAVIIIDV